MAVVAEAVRHLQAAVVAESNLLRVELLHIFSIDQNGPTRREFWKRWKLDLNLRLWQLLNREFVQIVRSHRRFGLSRWSNIHLWREISRIMIFAAIAECTDLSLRCSIDQLWISSLALAWPVEFFLLSSTNISRRHSNKWVAAAVALILNVSSK